MAQGQTVKKLWEKQPLSPALYLAAQKEYRGMDPVLCTDPAPGGSWKNSL
nr:MAG TPA: hypothetical protein [Caudoviricetes sp.]